MQEEKEIVRLNETIITNLLDLLKNSDQTNTENDYCKGPSYNTKNVTQKNSNQVYTQSFVLLGFLRNQKLISDFDSRYSKHVKDTIANIKKITISADAYSNSVYAYALALEGSANNTAASKKILEKLKKDNSHTNGDKRFYFNDAKNDSGLNYQISSYVALAYMALAKRELELISEVELIINWLANVKTYGEPYNEAMVTEALTEAAKLMSKAEANYKLTLTASDNEMILNVSKSNWRDYQYKEISTKSDRLELNATGQGYLSVDVVCEHYIQNANISGFIDLNVTAINYKSDEIGTLRICVKCKKECSDMIILEVQLQSGFVYDANINDFSKYDSVKVS